MNFCSNCGKAVTFQAVEGDTKMRYVCNSCETIHYQNPNVVVGCLPIWEDKVLLAKRSIEPRIGFWNVPGGYLENGETVAQGAVREVFEEACIKVEVIQLLTVFSIPHINQVYMHFLAQMPDLKFSPGIESLEVELFEEDTIPWEDIAFHSSVFTLKSYFKNRINGTDEVHVKDFKFPT